MAAAEWRLAPQTNAFAARPGFVEDMNVLAIPTPFVPTPPRQR